MAEKRFTAEERAAIKERAREAKSAGEESEVLEKIAEMSDADRAIAERLHALKANLDDGSMWPTSFA